MGKLAGEEIPGEGGRSVKPRTGWTADDLLSLPDDGNTYEIVQGELVREPPPAPIHQEIVGFVHASLWNSLEAPERPGLFMAPIAVILAEDTVVQPDLLFIGPERRAIIGDTSIHGAPDLVIEVLSPSTRRYDQTDKLRLYATHGVTECWLVDPEAREVRVFSEPVGGRYRRASTYHRGDLAAGAVLPWTLVVAELFGEYA